MVPVTDIAADRARLLEIIRDRAIVHGRVTLSSGKEADYYVDLRRVTLDGEASPLVGRVMLDLVADLDFDAVGGLTLGADPVSYAIAYASALAGRPVRAFTVRKEAKQHGTGRLIEGPYREGDRVVVVEDVITTGGSALRAAEAIRSAGGRIVGVLAVVDREEGGREAIEAAGYPVVALVRARDVVALMPD